MPLSVMEAMAKGLPVIASAVSGIPEEMGDTGILVTSPTEDFDATIKEVSLALKTLRDSPQQRKDVGHRGYQRSQAYFKRRDMTAKYEKIINQILDDCQSSGIQKREKRVSGEQFTAVYRDLIQVRYRYTCNVWQGWFCYTQQDLEGMTYALLRSLSNRACKQEWPIVEWGERFSHFCQEQAIPFEGYKLASSKQWYRLILEADSRIRKISR